MTVIDYLKKIMAEGYSFAQVERAFELPSGTLSRWYSSGSVPAAGLALLKLTSMYPWLVKVAVYNYRGHKKAMLKEAANLIFPG